jgi:hypothetical protein
MNEMKYRTTTRVAGASTEALLSRLDEVKRTGRGRWVARCPAHDDGSPSLSITETDDERVLLHCFVGCPAADVLRAVRLTFSDLYPERATDHHRPPHRRAFDATQALACIEREAMIAQVCASRMADGQKLAQQDAQRLLVAQGRIGDAVALSRGAR